ncbi:hypothetical protein LWM68_05490 [Niabella sp. W65]|nr:hypothetical protein [Niabella sp. W65]MCH7362263.1 hypothetical protein [Niabella sp. W65]
MDSGIIKRLEIVAVQATTPDSRTLVLKPLGWEPHYKAGQFLTLVFYSRSGEQRRSYSISSSPDAGEPLSITIKKSTTESFPGSWFINQGRGYIADIGYRRFFCTAGKNRTYGILFPGRGQRYHPCFSLIKTLLLTTPQQVFLFYSNRNEQQAIFYEELKSLQQQYKDRFYVHFMFSNRLDVYYSRLSHWLLTRLLDEHFVTINKKHILFYVCGPFDIC